MRSYDPKAQWEKKNNKIQAELTPVIAVPVYAQARGSRYHGDLEIMKSPKAYEVTDINTDFHALTSSISNT